jgi:hypothetical protein
MDRINLVLNRDQWRALMNVIMNFRFPKNVGNILNSCTADSLSRLDTIELIIFCGLDVLLVWPVQLFELVNFAALYNRK